MIAFPPQRPAPDGGYATAEGPLFYASTQAQQYRTPWVVWNSSTTVRIGKLADGISDTAGADLLLMNDSGTWVRPQRIALAFDQNALPVVAFQKDATTASVRKFVSSVKTEYTFAGLTPVLFYNGTAVVETGTTDVCCLYLKTGGTSIFARFQRENFATEYQFHDLPAGMALARLQAAHHVRINGSNYMQVWGIDTQGRQVVIRSVPYDPDLVYAADKFALDASAENGDTFATITFAQAGDKFTADVSAEDGALTSTIAIRNAPSDKFAEDVSAEDGVNTIVVVPRSAPSDKFTENISAEDGANTMTVVSGDNKFDKLTLDCSADSGSYP